MGLHLFNVGDIPVHVSVWYGLLLLYWFRGAEDARATLIWALVVTVSILAHELGHAMVARRFGLRPRILLHGLGGLCLHDRATRDRDDMLILAAGPSAGLLLGVGTWVLARYAPSSLLETEWFDSVVAMSLYVNIGWSLVNLLPIWPLDGGQLFRLLTLRVVKPARAELVTHCTALVLLAVALLLGGKLGGGMLLVLILWAAWSNIQALRGEGAAAPVRRVNKDAEELLSDAKQAYAREDFREAARLGHLLRGEGNVSERVMREGRLVLGLSCARIGEHADALNFLRKEKATMEVVEARIECFHALGRDEELTQLLRSEEFSQIAAERRDEILRVVRPDDASGAAEPQVS